MYKITRKTKEVIFRNSSQLPSKKYYALSFIFNLQLILKWKFTLCTTEQTE